MRTTVKLFTRLFVCLALMQMLSVPASAITVTFTSTTVAATTTYPGSTCTLRIYANPTFTASDGTTVMGSVPPSGSFYKSVPCTISGGVITIPSFTLHSTTDAIDNQNARYTAIFYDSKGVRRDTFLADFTVPSSFGANVTWAQIKLFKAGSQPFRDTNVYTRTQTNLQIQQALADVGVGKATTSSEGTSRVSVAPADPLHPIAVETTDPRVPTQAENDALQGTNGSPSNSNRFVTNTDPRLGGAVTSFNTRVGAVIPATNDYTWAQINKATSSLADLTTKSATDLTSGKVPLARLGDSGTPDTTTFLRGDNTWAAPIGQVASVFGRTGAVVAASNDYTFAQIGSKPTTLTGYGITDAVPVARQVIAGNGLTNGGALSSDVTLNVGAGTGITINANDVALDTAHPRNVDHTAVSISTAGLGLSGGGDISANRTITIASSSNPGAAASLLASQAGSPQLTLPNFLATSNLFVRDTSTGFTSPGTTVVSPVSGNAFRSTSYTTGLQGWNVNAAGDAEFNNLDVRGAIHSSVFVYNQLLATSGTLGVFKSACKLRTDAIVPASPTYNTTTINIDCVDQDGVSHATSQLFATGDVLRLKDGLTGDTWFTVASVSDQTTFWRYVATIKAGSNNATYRAGAGVADYGASGAGFIIQTADQANAPYLQMATHAATFTSADASGSLISALKTRIGNLNNSYGYATNLYGAGFGDPAAANIVIDPTNGIRIRHSTTNKIVLDASGNASFTGTITAPAGNIGGFEIGADYIRDTANSFGLASTVTGGDDVRFFAGASFANRATAPTRLTEGGAFTANNATITGAITVNSGTVAGNFSVTGAGVLSAGGGAVNIDVNGIKIATGTNSVNKIRWDNSGTLAAEMYTENSLPVLNISAWGNTLQTGKVVIKGFQSSGMAGASEATLALVGENTNGVSSKGFATLSFVGPGQGLTIGATTAPGSMLDVRGGDINISTQSRGLILKATDGATCYRLTVNNAGTLATASITCP